MATRVAARARCQSTYPGELGAIVHGAARACHDLYRQGHAGDFSALAQSTFGLENYSTRKV